MSRVDSVPAVHEHADDREPERGFVADSSCADARTEPSSGYFEPDDQPASITP